LVQPLWKAAWRFLKNLKIELPYDMIDRTGYMLLGIYSKECKSGYNGNTCTLTFIAVLFKCQAMKTTQKPYN
jgi:hypothetical protein